MRAWELNESVSIDPQNIEWVKMEFDPNKITAEDFNQYRQEFYDYTKRYNKLLTDFKVNDKIFDNIDDALTYMLALIQPRIDAKKKEEEKWAKRRWDTEGQPYAKTAELVSVSWLKRLEGNRLHGDVNIGYNPDTDDWDRGSLEDLAHSLKTRGIQEPIMINVGWIDGYAFIGEGNHRIEAAEMAGISKLPARVWMKKEAQHKYDSGSIRHEVSKDLTFELGDYKAQYLTKPSDVFKSLARMKK